MIRIAPYLGLHGCVCVCVFFFFSSLITLILDKDNSSLITEKKCKFKKED